MTLKSTPKLIKIERMCASDVKRVLEIEQRTGLSSWSESHYTDLIKNPDSFAAIARHKREVVGFIVARIIASRGNDAESFAEADIFNIGVLQAHQGKGIGGSLIETFLSAARKHKVERVWLEVRQSNQKAIEFYSRNGFTNTQIRKDFYSQPMENALIMKLEMK